MMAHLNTDGSVMFLITAGSILVDLPQRKLTPNVVSGRGMSNSLVFAEWIRSRPESIEIIVIVCDV